LNSSYLEEDFVGRGSRFEVEATDNSVVAARFFSLCCTEAGAGLLRCFGEEAEVEEAVLGSGADARGFATSFLFEVTVAYSLYRFW
jgi:hypothetical protein